jgi:hypothetical protein
MYGNMRVLCSSSSVEPICEFLTECSGWSPMMESSVSAATIPPIEWPTRMVCTEGSTVGEGVELATSRSITLFVSHSLNRETHSVRSPRVSYLGYVMVRMVTFGSACWRMALRCDGKFPDVC